MDYLNAFRALPHADAILVALGALVVLFALVRIVRSGLTICLWVLLGAFGLAAIAHGSGRAPWEAPDLAGLALPDVVDPPREVLRRLCLGFGEGDER